MAGNVKEWCWNATVDGLRGVRGGAWDEHAYMFTAIETYPPEYRREGIGFRCIKYTESMRGDEDGSIVSNVVIPGPLVPPPTPEELERLKKFFLVDGDAPLNEKSIRTEDAEFWRHEIIEIDAAYGKDRFTIHLLLPKASPSEGRKLQPIVYFPGTGAKGL